MRYGEAQRLARQIMTENLKGECPHVCYAQPSQWNYTGEYVVTVTFDTGLEKDVESIEEFRTLVEVAL